MKKILLVFLFAALYFASCDSDGDNSPNTNPPTYEEGVNFTLGFQADASCTCGGPDVAFNQVISDSRCPTSVVCVWAGEVTVELQINEESTIQLSLNPADSTLNADTLGQWIIQLLEVNPYPDEVEIIPAEDYEVVLLINSL